MGLFDRIRGKKDITPPAQEVMPPAASVTPAEAPLLTELKQGVLVLHWAAMADGVQADEEYDLIRRYIGERITATGAKDINVEALIAWVKGEKPTEAQVREAVIRLVDGTDHGQVVRHYAQALIQSDDDLDISEIQVMQRISRFFAEAEAIHR